MKIKKLTLSAITILSIIISSCSSISGLLNRQPEPPSTSETDQASPAQTGEKCGDGICDQFEKDKGICPQDCQDQPSEETIEDYKVEYEAINEFEYFVTNPTSGSKLYVKVFPSHLSSTNIPAIIFIPGGTGDSAMFTDKIPGGEVAEQFSQAGFISVVFDPEGRGRSEGEEDFNGHIGQDGLLAITEFVKELPSVGDIGYISISYGVSLATGALARFQDGPAIFLIDWEGPANRNDITVGCKSTNMDTDLMDGPQDRSCADDVYWAEREAEIFASDILVPYHRVQSLNDHVQPDASHAVDMVNAATNGQYGGSGQSPWTRLNDLAPNSVLTSSVEDNLAEIDKEKYSLMIEYAWSLFERFGSMDATEAETGLITGNRGKVYFGFMVHLEGWVEETNNRELFEKHMDAAFDLADVFERYGAKVTFEASPETIQASGTWDNFLLDLQNRGHGIGVHADRGYSTDPNYNLRLFTTELRKMKSEAESLGLIIQHVSGTCSELDWAKASIDAGYLFTTGGVGYCAMSMPEEMRPDEYKYCPNPGQCHGNMPLLIDDRIHPWRINTAKGDWTEDDPNGKLVILASDGGIKNLYEYSQDPKASHGDMEYTDEDLEILIEKVEEALTLADPDKINILYFSLSIGKADVDRIFYEKMFAALQHYLDTGRLEYKTMNEMYVEYMESN
jgi:hypothetical protein